MQDEVMFDSLYAFDFLKKVDQQNCKLLHFDALATLIFQVFYFIECALETLVKSDLSQFVNTGT